MSPLEEVKKETLARAVAQVARVCLALRLDPAATAGFHVVNAHERGSRW